GAKYSDSAIVADGLELAYCRLQRCPLQAPAPTCRWSACVAVAGPVDGGAASVHDRGSEAGHGGSKIEEGAGHGEEVEPLLHRGLPGVVVGPAAAGAAAPPGRGAVEGGGAV